MTRLMLSSLAAAVCMAAATDKGSSAKAAEDAAKEAAKTPLEKAVEANGPEGDKPALTQPDKAHDGEFTDITEANLAIIDLRQQLDAAKIAHESEAAGLRSQAAISESALADLKARMVAGNLTTTQRDLAGDAASALAGHEVSAAEAAAALVEVRVKTPMLVQPPPPRYYDDEVPPAPVSLVKGLNLVPPWVADHWIVKANSEDPEPKQLPNPTAAEPDLV
jgi:hypothetical protein